MMENLLDSLKSTFGTWLDSSSTSWVTETILVILFGLGLFFLVLPYFQNKPTLPPLRKHRNTRKHQMQLSGRCRDKKTDRALKACRDCLKELEEVRDLASHLQRHLGKITDKGTIHQLSSQEHPGELSPFSPVLVAGDCQSLKFLYLDTLESQQEHLPCRLSEASLWGNPTNRQVEAGSLSLVNLDVQKLLETLITKRVELKIWKENEKEVQAGYHLTSLGKRIKSLGDKQDTLGRQHFWSIEGKAGQLLGPEKPLYPDILGTIYRRQAASSSGISFCAVTLWWLLSQFLGLL